MKRRPITKMKTVLARTNISPVHKIRIRKKAHAVMNQRIASGINVDQLLAKSNVEMLDVNNNGVVRVDFNNPNHRRWLEE
jgi:hypothetical protein